MVLTLLFLPLSAFLILSLLGRLLGRLVALTVALASLSLASLVALYGFFFILSQGIRVETDLSSWLHLSLLDFRFNLLWDPLSGLFVLLICLITLLVLLYSLSYMGDDPHLVNFFAYLCFFAFAMLLLVLAGNFILLFLGWEAVGLASYLLINFWHSRSLANSGALKAIFFNRLGDVSFLAALAWMFMLFRSVDFQVIAGSLPQVLAKEVSLVSFGSGLEWLALFLVLAAMAKSAQLFLHPWLPDAMEGPTPVSALLHSATMVTAGIFLLIRAKDILSFAPKVSLFLALVALFTSIFSSLVGLNQNDIKRIIAFSTCSQLGFIMFTVALGNHSAALFHLFNHAFFKALLFLSAGAIIHAIHDQDIRSMGALVFTNPLIYVICLLGSLSLGGFPLLSGFYSKDFIFESNFSLYFASIYPLTLLGSLSAAVTIFYSFRLLYDTFLLRPNVAPSKGLFLGEASRILFLPMSLLALLSLGSGFFFQGFFLDPSFFWMESLTDVSFLAGALDSEFISLAEKLRPSFFALQGLLGASLFYYGSLSDHYRLYKGFLPWIAFFARKFHFDSLYNFFLAGTTLHLVYGVFLRLLDKGLLEHWGPFGLYSLVSSLGRRLAFFSSGFIYHLLLLFLLALFLLPLYLFLSYPVLFLLYLILPLMLMSK